MGAVSEDPHQPPPPGATEDRPSGPEASPAPPASSGEPAWPARLGSAAGSTARWLSRPRVRLTVIGVALLVIGGLVISNSVWTLPLVVVGAVMVVVAWVGHRLEGRLTLEWGETGAELAFRATVKPAEAPERAVAPRPADAVAPRPAGAVALQPGASANGELRGAPDEVIEGEAHTVEIDVADLKALIAAAEGVDGAAAPAAAPADIRIRRAAQSG